MYHCSKKLVTCKEHCCFDHSDFPAHSMFTSDVCWGSLGTSIFGNSSSAASNTRSRLPSGLSFRFLWLWLSTLKTKINHKKVIDLGSSVTCPQYTCIEFSFVKFKFLYQGSRKPFLGCGVSKNIGHHGWHTSKSFQIKFAKFLQIEKSIEFRCILT